MGKVKGKGNKGVPANPPSAKRNSGNSGPKNDASNVPVQADEDQKSRNADYPYISTAQSTLKSNENRRVLMEIINRLTTESTVEDFDELLSGLKMEITHIRAVLFNNRTRGDSNSSIVPVESIVAATSPSKLPKEVGDQMQWLIQKYMNLFTKYKQKENELRAVRKMNFYAQYALPESASSRPFINENEKLIENGQSSSENHKEWIEYPSKDRPLNHLQQDYDLFAPLSSPSTQNLFPSFNALGLTTSPLRSTTNQPLQNISIFKKHIEINETLTKNLFDMKETLLSELDAKRSLQKDFLFVKAKFQQYLQQYNLREKQMEMIVKKKDISNQLLKLELEQVKQLQSETQRENQMQRLEIAALHDSERNLKARNNEEARIKEKMDREVASLQHVFKQFATERSENAQKQMYLLMENAYLTGKMQHLVEGLVVATEEKGYLKTEVERTSLVNEKLESLCRVFQHERHTLQSRIKSIETRLKTHFGDLVDPILSQEQSLLDSDSPPKVAPVLPGTPANGTEESLSEEAADEGNPEGPSDRFSQELFSLCNDKYQFQMSDLAEAREFFNLFDQQFGDDEDAEKTTVLQNMMEGAFPIIQGVLPIDSQNAIQEYCNQFKKLSEEEKKAGLQRNAHSNDKAKRSFHHQLESFAKEIKLEPIAKKPQIFKVDPGKPAVHSIPSTATLITTRTTSSPTPATMNPVTPSSGSTPQTGQNSSPLVKIYNSIMTRSSIEVRPFAAMKQPANHVQSSADPPADPPSVPETKPNPTPIRDRIIASKRKLRK